MWEFGRCSDEEGLRLILAFFQIDDADVRLAIIRTAELAAARSKPIVVMEPSLQQDNRPLPLPFPATD